MKKLLLSALAALAGLALFVFVILSGDRKSVV